MISLIVAASTNNVIGNQGDLPWRLSADLRRFKKLTMGKPIVMGRKTWESIGRPLPGRHNIVVTRQGDYAAQGCTVVSSVEAAIDAAGDADEIMIIGGSYIYDAFMAKADRIYMTRVHADVDGDTWFPELPESEWIQEVAGEHAADADNAHPCTFLNITKRVQS
jgi:dihydrofolate reductase